MSSDQARYRSGAVARMVGIPVSTLRIWERRYQVVGPRLTDSGHRLYTGCDVERLRLIRQLIALGHAVGTLARLDDAELQQIADARAALAAPPMVRPAPARLALLGLGLARRLGPLALRRSANWADLAAAEAAFNAPADPATAPPQADLLVAEMPTLQPASAERLLRLKQGLGARRAVVVYGFGAEPAAQRLRDAGCRLLRAPLADTELAGLIDELLAGLEAPAAAGPGAGAAQVPAGPIELAGLAGLAAWADPPPRRFDEAGLAQLSGASSTVACECPRHLSDLVLQLGAFETYSAECLQRSPADGALHAHLQRVAGHARAMLEAALVRVAEAEAIALPPPPAGPALRPAA